MSNELRFGWRPGEALSAEILKADGSIRESGITMTEVGTSGVYFGSPAAIVAGDTVIVDDGSNKVGFFEYQPEVDTVLINGDGAIDTLVGADGDTHQTLSEQLSTVTLDQRVTLNIYADNESQDDESSTSHDDEA